MFNQIWNFENIKLDDLVSKKELTDSESRKVYHKKTNLIGYLTNFHIHRRA